MTGKQITGAVTGLALAAGATAYLVSQKQAPAKRLRQTTTQAVRTIGSVMNTLEHMMK